MASEVANNQAVSAPAPEENVAEKKVEEVEAAVKDGDANAPAKAGKGDETCENDSAPPAQEPKVKAAPAPKLTVHKADFEKDVIYLYQFSRTPFLPSISPYCLKVETWLRLAGLKYEVNETKRKLEKKTHLIYSIHSLLYKRERKKRKKSYIRTLSQLFVRNYGLVLSFE